MRHAVVRVTKASRHQSTWLSHSLLPAGIACPADCHCHAQPPDKRGFTLVLRSSFLRA